MTNNDTICAIATASGGAIGIVRVSGPDAVATVSSILDRDITSCRPSSLRYCRVLTATGEVLDEVVASIYRAPHSYTGEDSVELSCHGSGYILQNVLQRLFHAGCRSAFPGEFTMRAFLHGKMDLSQAEAVADLIASQSEASHRLAMNQMRGIFSKHLSELRDQLLQLTSLLELELDFSDHEDVEFADRSQLCRLTDTIQHEMTRLVESFQIGNALKQGVPVAIVGDTNVGKSTLLNALLGDEKAIVSDIPGTTRDVVEDTMVVDGVLFRFIDTAGIRNATDTIEHLGIERTFQQMDRAQIVLWVIDGSQLLNCETASQIIRAAQGKTLIRVINKSDLPCCDNHYDEGPTVHISAKHGDGLQRLQAMLLEEIAHNMPLAIDVVVTNQRHYEALCDALSSIRRVREGIDLHLSGDLVCEDLRQCLFHLSDIVGEVTTDDVLQNIFSHFCIGK